MNDREQLRVVANHIHRGSSARKFNGLAFISASEDSPGGPGSCAIGALYEGFYGRQERSVIYKVEIGEELRIKFPVLREMKYVLFEKDDVFVHFDNNTTLYHQILLPATGHRPLIDMDIRRQMADRLDDIADKLELVNDDFEAFEKIDKPWTVNKENLNV